MVRSPFLSIISVLECGCLVVSSSWTNRPVSGVVRGSPFGSQRTRGCRGPVPDHRFVLRFFRGTRTPLGHGSLFRTLNLSNRSGCRNLHHHLETVRHSKRLIFAHHRYCTLPRHVRMLGNIMLKRHSNFN